MFSSLFDICFNKHTMSMDSELQTDRTKTQVEFSIKFQPICSVKLSIDLARRFAVKSSDFCSSKLVFDLQTNRYIMIYYYDNNNNIKQSRLARCTPERHEGKNFHHVFLGYVLACHKVLTNIVIALSMHKQRRLGIICLQKLGFQ